MSLHGLLDAVVKDTALAEAITAAADGNRMHVDLVGPPAARPFAIAALARETGRPVLAVTATGREAEDLAAALRSLLPPEGVVEYPSWETLPHERLSPRSDTVGRRLAVLRRLAHPRPDDPETGPVSVVVAPVRSVLQPQVKGLGDLEPVALRTGSTADLNEVVEALAAAAYARVELVEKRGEFAVRGGILDVFPPTEEHPLRVEFWGDDVEEIRYFKVADQRSLEVADHGLWAPPCRELLLTEDVRERAAAWPRTTPNWANCSARSPRASRSRAWSPWPPSSWTTWSCCWTCCPRAPWRWSATRSGSGPGPPTWSPPRRSSSRRPGRPRRAGARHRSTWTRPPVVHR